MPDDVKVSVYVDTYEPEAWCQAFSTITDEEGRPTKVYLKGMGYEGDILIVKDGPEGRETWGIERKTFTDAMNSWMSKRLIRQAYDLTQKVDHPMLMIIEEPEKRLAAPPNSPYRKYAKHIPNLESHLNRISMEVCPVIRLRDEPSAFRQVHTIISRIRDGDFGQVKIQDAKVRDSDPVVEFLMSIPRVGKQRSALLKQHFGSLEDLVLNLDRLEAIGVSEADAQTIRNFLAQPWASETALTKT